MGSAARNRRPTISGERRQHACLFRLPAETLIPSASYRRLQAGSVRYPDQERGDLEAACSQLIVIARDESQVTS
jgi:hypothetical protein